MITPLSPEVKYPDFIKLIVFFAIIGLFVILPVLLEINTITFVFFRDFFALLVGGLRTFEILLYNRHKKINKLASTLVVNFIIFGTIGAFIGTLFFLIYTAITLDFIF